MGSPSVSLRQRNWYSRTQVPPLPSTGRRFLMSSDCSHWPAGREGGRTGLNQPAKPTKPQGREGCGESHHLLHTIRTRLFVAATRPADDGMCKTGCGACSEQPNPLSQQLFPRLGPDWNCKSGAVRIPSSHESKSFLPPAFPSRDARLRREEANNPG